MDGRAAPVDEHALATLGARLRDARNVMVLTGAGISTESGIPDFRGPNGIWTKDPKAERLSSLQHYMADPELRKHAWQTRLDHPGWAAEPNPAHLALAELERKGKPMTLVTQNIDGLHLKAGNSSDVVIEIHGTMRDVVCMSCGERAPMQRALDRVRAGEEDPECRSCGGILKSATISFGQNLVREDLDRAYSAAGAVDLFMAAGTSLTVFPVAQLPQVALDAGADVAILNAEPTPFDALATWVLRGPLSLSLPRIVGFL
ncbi:MAG: SIR2 family NAD-dependent protein deacylase [Actinomycetota bacterium]